MMLVYYFHSIIHLSNFPFHLDSTAMIQSMFFVYLLQFQRLKWNAQYFIEQSIIIMELHSVIIIMSELKFIVVLVLNCVVESALNSEIVL
jgi:hypothetical protein